jgi:hypothetical protein
MKRPFYIRFIVGGSIIAAALLLHVWLQVSTVSLVVAPLAIAAILPFIGSSSLVLLLTLILLSELMTTFPLGVMTATIITPFLIHRLAARVPADISLPFFLLITGTVATQLTIIIIANLLTLPRELLASWQDIWYSMPLWPGLYALGVMSVFVFFSILVWYELVSSSPKRFHSS